MSWFTSISPAVEYIKSISECSNEEFQDKLIQNIECLLNEEQVYGFDRMQLLMRAKSMQTPECQEQEEYDEDDRMFEPQKMEIQSETISQAINEFHAKLKQVSKFCRVRYRTPLDDLLRWEEDNSPEPPTLNLIPEPDEETSPTPEDHENIGHFLKQIYSIAPKWKTSCKTELFDLRPIKQKIIAKMDGLSINFDVKEPKVIRVDEIPVLELEPEGIRNLLEKLNIKM